jgi:triacylglycerol lipase
MRALRYILPSIIACALTVVGSATAYADDLPVPYGNGEMLRIATTDWNGAVPGANDYSCTPSPQHPNPVVLINSTFLTDAVNWTTLAPYLHNQGYCVYTFNYGRDMYNIPPGINGLDPIALSAVETVAVVDRVLAATGAKKVDLVGHSQGGFVGRYYINALGGADKVDKMVLLSSPWTVGIGSVDFAAIARNSIPHDLYDSIVRNGVIWPGPSTFLDPWVFGEMQAVQPHIQYTEITDIADEVNLQTLGGNASPDVPNARTIWINDVCPTDLSQHFAQPYSPTAVALIANALDPMHPLTPPCTFVPLYRP